MHSPFNSLSSRSSKRGVDPGARLSRTLKSAGDSAPANEGATGDDDGDGQKPAFAALPPWHARSKERVRSFSRSLLYISGQKPKVWSAGMSVVVPGLDGISGIGAVKVHEHMAVVGVRNSK
jgi:hypothetical protein